MKRRLIILIILAGIVLAGMYGKRWYYGELQPNSPDTVNIYGTIDIRDARLAFNEQERIIEVLVEEGEQVVAGQVLARLNSDRLQVTVLETQALINAQREMVKRLKKGTRQQEIDQARAEIDATHIRIANAEKVYKRFLRTSGTGATSRQDKDDALAALQVEKAQLTVREKTLDLLVEGPRQEDISEAEYQLEALNAKQQLLSIRLSDMTLLAPDNGTIQSRILEPGEMAGPTRPVFTLALTDPKWVRAYIPEPDLGKIHIGMKAEIETDSFPDSPVEGWVGYISPVAEFTPRTVQTEDLRTQLVYETRVFVRDPGDKLRLGMPVTVILETQSEQKQSIPSLEDTNNIPDSGA